MLKCARALALIACLGLVAPVTAMAASFSDFASGVKDLTDSAKDINGIVKGEKEEPAPQKQQAAQKPSKRQSSSTRQEPVQDDSMRGG